MAKKGTFLLALSLLVAGLLVVGGCSFVTSAEPIPTRTPVAQPEPAIPGVPAPATEAAYRAAQADPSLTEEQKVRSAVDTYFTLRYESYLRDEALDLGIVVDTSSKEGKTLHDYELGRLQYWLQGWRRA
ncbi:MAG: hypothetical protein ACYC1C_13430, partial [Chloroflexota bacterium]